MFSNGESMRLYFIKASILLTGDWRRDSDPPTFDLLLEGDDPAAEDGDWSATGPGIAFLRQANGAWRIRLNTTGDGQVLQLMDGADPNFMLVPFLGIAHWVAELALPESFPPLLDVEYRGIADGEHRWLDLRWKLVRQYFKVWGQIHFH
jgi:hypothetical protein